LSSKSNLFRRGIIPISGCGLQKLENHLFVSCNLFGQIWQLVWNWICVHLVDPSNIVDHFHQFGTSSGYAESMCSFMYLIWFASSWLIWKERNDRLFRGKKNSLVQLLENVKLLSFWWFKIKIVVFHYSFHNWLQNLFLCEYCLICASFC